MKLDRLFVIFSHKHLFDLMAIFSSGTFVFGILAEFGALLGPGAIKTALIE